MILKLPPRFIRDCLECDCDVGYYDELRGELHATQEQLHELQSRAEHYAHHDGPDGIGDGGALVRSAQALLKAIIRETKVDAF